MRSMVVSLFLVPALALTAADVFAMSWGGGRHRHGGSSSEGGSSNYVGGSVPEPSTLYAVGSGLALLAGAGWYIRRRK